MGKVDYIMLGAGWEGEILNREYESTSFTHNSCPTIGSVIPGQNKPREQRASSAIFYVEEFIAADGKTYLLARAADGYASSFDVNAILLQSAPNPNPYK